MYEPAIREGVRKLRKEGYTFREIMAKFPFLAKGTVSGWTSGIKLTPEQERKILEKQLKALKKLFQKPREKWVK